MTVEVGKKYRHFKGHIVEVIAIGTNTETMEEMVVYKHLEQNKVWIRPLEMFADENDISSRADNITGQKTRFEEYKG
ncbi:MAG: DUF1653 domain-containing protein [Clostridia bacterium]